MVWLAFRWIIGRSLSVDSAQNAGVLSNILFILLLVFIGINAQYRRLKGQPSGFLDDLKACMKPALIYVLMSVVFIGVYYAFLSDDMEELRRAHMQAFNELIHDETKLAEYLSQYPDKVGKGSEALFQEKQNEVNQMISVQTKVMFSSIALTFASFGYSLLAVLFWRSFVRKW